MTTPQIRPGRNLLTLEALQVPDPYQAYVAPISEFPLPESEAEPIRSFLQRFTDVSAKMWHLNTEVFIQLTQLHLGNGERRLPIYGREWLPETGLGIWPDREPPTLWTMAEFESAKPGERMRPLTHQVFRISASGEARHNARDVMLDLGSILQVMTADTPDVLLANAKQLLLPPIQELSFRSFPFYIPLLECRSLENVTSKELDEWLCGATIYVRESFQDRGILIVSARPLDPVLAELGGQFCEQPRPHWQLTL